MNITMITGNLGKDPVFRKTGSGKPVVNFRMAVDERITRTDENGNRVPDKITHWMPVVVFGPQAEVCARYLQRGSRVAVQGKLIPRSYPDADGKTQHTFDIDASSPYGNVEFLGNIRAANEDQVTGSPEEAAT